MPLTCTNPDAPVPVRLNVLSDTTFVFDEVFWSFSGGWVWDSNGKVVATSVTNGIHFEQKSSKFVLSYGSGDKDIIDGESFEFSFTIANQADDNDGKIRVVWGANVSTFERGNGIHSGIIEAPGAGNFLLAVQSGANTFTGEITNVSLFKQECVAASNEHDAGNRFGTDIEFSSNYYLNESHESPRADMRISDDEINDDFDRDLIGGQ